MCVHFINSIVFMAKWISLQMIIRQGRFVEYSVFGKETSVDWTIISDAKGTQILMPNVVENSA